MALPYPPQRSQGLHVLLVLLAVLAAALASATHAAGAPRAARITLPGLSGPDRAGTLVLHLVDRSRADRSFRSGHRELMVQLWYPAARGGAGYAPYLPARVAAIIEHAYGLPAGTASGIRTHARIAAPVAAGAHPVLLYSPGSSELRSDATALVENLASEGFVVVTVDHTHEAQFVEFPDGRLVRGTFVDTGPASNERALRVRVADTRFVLDQLTKLDRRGPFAGRLDLGRVGMFGFSLGGATAAAAMLADPRLKAGADLDGSLYGPVVREGLRRPFLLMLSPIPGRDKRRCGAPCAHLTEFHFFRSFYSRLRGPRYAVELARSGHESFEDSVWIEPQLAAIAPAAAGQFDVGSIGERPAVTSVSGYLTAFFDRYLRGTPEPVLRDPTGTYPALTAIGPTGGRRPANVQVTHDTDDGHVEPDVAVDPRNPANVLGACQFEPSPRKRLPGTFASFDGGRSWRDNGVLPLPGGYEQGADTTVAFDGRGNGFVVALLAHGGGGHPSRVERGGVFLWRTRDGGRTFAEPRAVYVGRGFQDHPWLAVRRGPRTSELYVAWTNAAGLELAVSRDDGASFARSRLVVPGSAASNPVVTVSGRRSVDVFYEQFSGGVSRISLRVVTSSDDGAHFGGPALIGTVAGPLDLGFGPKGNGVTPPPLLAAAAAASGTRTAVAIAGTDRRAGHPVIELWERAATGRWAGPLRPVRGADAALTQVQPRLVLAGAVVDISYFTISRAGRIGEHLARGGYGRSSFAAQTVSTRPFRAAGFLGDYQALAAAGRNLYLLWNDGRSGRLEVEAAHVTVR